jgi:hypothetical protein
MSSYLLYGLVIGFLFFGFHYSYGIENVTPTKIIDFEKILGEYWSWWENSPEDAPEANPTCSIGIDTQDSFVFLLNSFNAEDANYNCSGNPIPKGYSILLPLLTSFCSQGDNGLYGATYDKILDCTLNLDRGKVQGIVSINDKEIVNIVKDNGNGIDMNRHLQNNLPQIKYYKEIVPTKFVDLLVTRNNTSPTNWEKPQDFEKGPIYYRGVFHCECVIIDTNEMGPGNYVLKYIVDAEAGKSTINLSDEGWQFRSTTTYQLVIQ